MMPDAFPSLSTPILHALLADKAWEPLLVVHSYSALALDTTAAGLHSNACSNRYVCRAAVEVGYSTSANGQKHHLRLAYGPHDSCILNSSAVLMTMQLGP